MNKKVFGKKLSRSRPSREALFASLAKALIKNGKIVTTHAKAKAVVPFVERIVTLAKKGGLTQRRSVLAKLDNSRGETDILFKDVIKVFGGKKSGFTRIISLPRRVGDNAKMVRLEWSEEVIFEDAKKDKKDEKGKKVKEIKSEKAGKKKAASVKSAKTK